MLDKPIAENEGDELVADVSKWPPKKNLGGVFISTGDYDQSVAAIVAATVAGRSGLVSCYATHAVVEMARNHSTRQISQQFDMITADGQPVRWALNWFYNAGMKDRVYGPELLFRLCRMAAELQIPVYFFGGSEAVIESLSRRLKHEFPELNIVGSESPPYRPLTEEEHCAVADRIHHSGAKIVFIGLGCPKQDYFAFHHRDSIRAVQVCVGAAFDFHAGVMPMAPPWMQARGLEWLFRLYQEPGRLWKRYLYSNTVFLLMLGKFFLSRCYSKIGTDK